MLDLIERRGWMPRFYYSHYHIMAAAYFARESAHLEDEHRDKESISSDVFCRHRAYVTGCLFSAVSFLEGQINEIFTDATARTYRSSYLNEHFQYGRLLKVPNFMSKLVSRRAILQLLDQSGE